MNHPFILFEMEIDFSDLKNYFPNITKPGIYAIPENSNVSVEKDQNNLINQKNNNQSDNNLINHSVPNNNINNNINNNNNDINIKNDSKPEFNLSFNDDEIQKYDLEIEPLKKVFLLNKIYELSQILKTRCNLNTDIDLILKFGPSLNYSTLRILCYNLIKQIDKLTQDQNIYCTNI